MNKLFLWVMTKRRINMSIIIMLLAIAVIVTFQCDWLYKNYKEEQQNLRLRTNVLFRESVLKCQSQKFRIDSILNVKFTPGTGAISVLNNMKGRVRDSIIKFQDFHNTMVVSVKKPKGIINDTVIVSDSPVSLQSMKTFFKTDVDYKRQPGRRVIKILEGIDSLQDSVTVQDVDQKYRLALQKEHINVPYVISRTNLPPGQLMNANNNEADNELTIGFTKPCTFRIDIQNTVPYILRKLTPEIIFSILLVALTIVSFVLLLRNLIQQRRLTQLKNDFISNITHELKTPIATVSVAIEALKNFNALHDPQRTKEYLDISTNELQRLSLLVDKVLKLSMFEKQQIELKKEPFDCKQLVEEVLASMRLQFEKYKAQVNVETQGNDFTVTADRLHFTSVVFNLLDNALKYSKANPSIQVGLIDRSDHIELSVTDNGIGISSENQKKIFDKFFRVPAGDTHNVKGYGLGLSYVAYVVQRHKGTIHLESQQGIGSRFVINLPRMA